MDSMLEEEKNLKVTENSAHGHVDKFYPSLGGSMNGLPMSHSKTNKLITALYMVTDVMDKDEPLRNKLRTLGVNIVSDTHSLADLSLDKNINEVLSLMDIAFTIGMISEMNCSILKKEFIELKRSIQKADGLQLPGGRVSLSDFFAGGDSSALGNHIENQPNVRYDSNKYSDKIGVPKGGIMMKSLNKNEMSDRTKSVNNNKNNFDLLKRQRRDEIVKIIKTRYSAEGLGATITDIKNESKGALSACGEKTLQRELVSMVQDGVLNRTGEKRWSRYLLK